MSTVNSIGIIAFDGVLTSELIAPTEVFKLASERDWFKDTRIVLIGVEQQPVIRTAEGISIQVDATIADDLTVDVLLVPGGSDMSALLQHQGLNTFIQKHNEAEWIGSFCAGAFLLGNAGVLDGQKATTWHGGEAELQAQYPAIQVVHDKPVVLDKRRITANGGLVGYSAAIVLLGHITSADHAREIYESLNMGRLGSWETLETTIMNTPGL